MEAKVKAIWFKEGDKNGKYFHKVSNSHRHHNSMRQLSIDGEISSDQKAIMGKISSFYQNLYTEESFCRPMLDGLGFSSITEEKAAWLERPFEEEELSKVVRSMNGDKSPCPDGFSMAIFHACWHVI